MTLGGGAVGASLLAYNLYFFDVPMGGYAAIERMHPWAHGTSGTWTAPFFEGLAGTLISPSHGLLVYSPWVGLAVGLGLAGLVTGGLPGRNRGLSIALVVGLGLTLVLLSKYSCWWGGHCFGPRFWIDSGPILGMLLAIGLEWAWPRLGRAGRATLTGVLMLMLAWSIALQAIGAACYPSTWHGRPANADRHHERLWDWRDTEVSRGLKEGVKPRAGQGT
jgi:hypothetical protein